MLKSLQQHRFADVDSTQYVMESRLSDLDISRQSDYPLLQTNTPIDMLQSKGRIGDQYYPADISKANMEFNIKPRWYLNKDSVKRGVVLKYKTSSNEVPPPPNVPFAAIDEGQANPKLMRSTMYKVPVNPTIHNDVQVPMGVVVHPFANLIEDDTQIPIANCGEDGPIRCTTCGGYINPGTVLLDNGTRGKCNFCSSVFPINDTKYACIIDKSSLPELYFGSYEYEVTGKYIYHNPTNPYYVFILDTSIEAYNNGLFNQAIQAISLTLDSILYQDVTKICIITVNQYVQFYQVPDDFSKPLTVYQCCESEDPFIPIPLQKLMLSVFSEREKIDYLLSKLYEVFIHESQPASFNLNLSSAFNIAYEILEMTGGRVVSFYSKLDNFGPFKNLIILKHETEDETTTYKPKSAYYSELGAKMRIK